MTDKSLMRELSVPLLTVSIVTERESKSPSDGC